MPQKISIMLMSGKMTSIPKGESGKMIYFSKEMPGKVWKTCTLKPLSTLSYEIRLGNRKGYFLFIAYTPVIWYLRVIKWNQKKEM